MVTVNSATDLAGPSRSSGTRMGCERIVVFNKRDLVPEWGIEVRETPTSRHLTYSSNSYFFRHIFLAISEGIDGEIPGSDLFLCQLAPP